MSGLKINFHTLEFYCLGGANTFKDHYSDIFTSPWSSSLNIYLGIPIDSKKLGSFHWLPTKEKQGEN